MSDDTPTYNGRYEVQRRIARGGMADVFLAKDLLLARPVAVKVLFPEFASDPSFVARFRREAQAAANLNHPNIVGVYDWGQEAGTYYIVMEFIDGRSLSEILRTQGTPPAKTGAGIAADVAAALGFAHRNGVVHRDIKPGNIMITNAGHVKVADFGIARAISASAEENLTQTGSVMGTATYFSPEQAQGHDVSGRSDLYSLGIVMYEMAHGRPPFVADSPIAVAYKHVQEAPAPLRAEHPDVPAGYEAITMRLLAKSPDERYRDAEALRTDLRRFAEGQRVRAGAGAAGPTDEATVVGAAVAGVGSGAGAGPGASGTGGAPPAAPAPPTGAEPELKPPAAPPRRSRTGWFLVLLVLALLVLGGLLFAFASVLGIGADETGVEVPDVRGESVQAAELLLAQAGFEVDKTTRESSTAVPIDVVISQDPAGGDRAEEGSTIRLVISTGEPAPEQVDLPPVEGLSEDEARLRLIGVGFQVDISRREDDEFDEGVVIRQNPPASAGPLDVGTTIELIVSLGPPPPPPTTSPPATTSPPPTTEEPTTSPPPTTEEPTTSPPPTTEEPTTTSPPTTTTEPPTTTEPETTTTDPSSTTTATTAAGG